MAQSSLEIVRVWQEKSSEMSRHCKDALISAVNKGFDAIAAVLAKDSDHENALRALDYLSSERSIALKYEKSKDDSLRHLMYGVLESLHVSLIEWNEERNQIKETGEIPTQTEESAQSLPEPSNEAYQIMVTNPPIEPKEESIDIHEYVPQEYQISASELMRDENMFKEEEMDDENIEVASQSLEIHSTTANFTRSLRPSNLGEEPSDIAQSIPADIQALVPPVMPPLVPVPTDYVPPSDNASTTSKFTHSLPFNSVADPTDMSQILPRDDRNSGMDDRFGNSPFNDRNSTPLNFDDAYYGDQHDLPADSLIDNEEEMKEEEAIVLPPDTQKDISDSPKVETRKRPSRHVSRPVQYNESMKDSDADVGSSVKKSKSNSTRKDVNKGRSCNGDDESESGSKRLRVKKKNDTELECPECDHRTRSVECWVKHLRKNHSTTPEMAGLALLCDCGHESLSYSHSRMCNGNTTVIRKRDGPIRRVDDEKVTPQCVLCEAFPTTASGYAQHLQIHHKSSLKQNGIYLKCSCSLEVHSSNGHLKHLDGCNPRQFTLLKLNDK